MSLVVNAKQISANSLIRDSIYEKINEIQTALYEKVPRACPKQVDEFINFLERQCVTKQELADALNNVGHRMSAGELLNLPDFAKSGHAINRYHAFAIGDFLCDPEFVKKSQYNHESGTPLDIIRKYGKRHFIIRDLAFSNEVSFVAAFMESGTPLEELSAQIQSFGFAEIAEKIDEMARNAD